MKTGDLVQVLESHWSEKGMIGIIVHDLEGKGRAFKILFGNGKIRPKLAKQLELLSEN